VYFPYCFVVYGCSNVVEGDVRAHGKEVETCIGLLEWVEVVG
jgi:hypothetical protein